jgi:hypothetical protein
MGPPTLLFQFVFVVIFGMCTGVVVDFLQCLAHKYRMHRIFVDLRSLPLFVFIVFFFICILGISLVGQGKIIDLKRQRITFVAAFIIAVLITGYFFYLPCDTP